MDVPNTIWIKAFAPDGFQVGLTLAISSAADALRVIEEVKAAGFTPQVPPEHDPSNVELIDVVMRREQVRDGGSVPIIDFFPAWQHGNKFGKYKHVSHYLDTADDVAAFESASGLKLDSIPLYNGQGALMRTPGRRHQCETTPKRAFKVERVVTERVEEGETKQGHRFGRYLPADGAPLVMPSPTPPASNGASAPATPKADANGHDDNAWIECKPEVTLKQNASGAWWYAFTGENGATYVTDDRDLVASNIKHPKLANGTHTLETTPYVKAKRDGDRYRVTDVSADIPF